MIKINADFEIEANLYGYYEFEIEKEKWDNMTEEEKIIYTYKNGVPTVVDILEISEDISNIEVTDGEY